MSPVFNNQDEYFQQSFKDLHLEGEEIRSVQFVECTFTGCNMREAQLLDCKFIECHFENCDLSLAGITGSDFGGTSFIRSQCIGLNWVEAGWSEVRLQKPLRFEHCAVSYSTFFGLNLQGASLVYCMAKEVDFSEADLTGADCQNTDFTRARFFHTDLTGSDFRGADEYTIHAGQNTLKDTHFSMPEAMSLLHSLDIILDE